MVNRWTNHCTLPGPVDFQIKSENVRTQYTDIVTAWPSNAIDIYCIQGAQKVLRGWMAAQKMGTSFPAMLAGCIVPLQCYGTGRITAPNVYGPIAITVFASLRGLVELSNTQRWKMAGGSEVLLPSPNQKVQQIRHVVLASRCLPTDVTRLAAAEQWKTHQQSTKFPSVSVPLIAPRLLPGHPEFPYGSMGGTACVLMPGPVNIAGVKGLTPGGLSTAILEVFLLVLELTLAHQMTDMPTSLVELAIELPFDHANFPHRIRR
jgi:hypothetical protein